MSEHKGIFVIQYKNYNEYKLYLTPSGFISLDINDAQLFEMRTKTYKRILELGIDKKCIVEEVKQNG